MRGFLSVLLAAGCNQAFGLDPAQRLPPIDADRPDGDPRIDLDRDRIPDIEDPCIAPATDLVLDFDMDGVANGVDSCPFDANVADDDTRGDSDGDGIGDACDPFVSLAGDRLRCLMQFADPDLNVAMWTPRESPQSWYLYIPRFLTGQTGSIAAAWPVEDPDKTTTFDVRGQLYEPAMGKLTVLARAAPAPTASEVGCTMTYTTSTWVLGTQPGQEVALSTVPRSGNAPAYQMTVTIAPSSEGRANLRCGVRGGGSLATVPGAVELPGGRLGFATTARFSVLAVAIYERDDAPDL